MDALVDMVVTVAPRPRRRLEAAERQAVVAEYEAGEGVIEALARRHGCSHSQVGRIVKGHQPPSLPALRRRAEMAEGIGQLQRQRIKDMQHALAEIERECNRWRRAADLTDRWLGELATVRRLIAEALPGGWRGRLVGRWAGDVLGAAARRITSTEASMRACYEASQTAHSREQ